MEEIWEKRSRSRRLQRLRAGALIAVSLFVLIVAFDLVTYGDKVHRGLSIAGTEIGGMSRVEAIVALSGKAKRLEKRGLTLIYAGRRMSLPIGGSGYSPDIERAVQDAYRFEKSRDPVSGVFLRLYLLVFRRDLPCAVHWRSRTFASAARRVSAWLGRPPRDASIIVRGRDLLLVKSKSGIVADRKRLLEDVYARVSGLDDGEIEVKAASGEPDVSDEEASAAMHEAGRVCSRPLVVRCAGEGRSLKPDELWSLLAFAKRPRRGRLSLQPILRREGAQLWLADFLNEFEVDAVDASFAVNGEKVSITPSRTGRSPNLTASYESMLAGLLSEGAGRYVTASMTVIAPELVEGDLKRMRIETRLGYFSTDYSSSSSSRMNNIRTVAGKISGALIPPGGIFSFNDRTGPRTKEEGYEEAPVIVGGQLMPGVGGGVCQVATTVFNAAFFSGLHFTERHPHYFYISHYPDGRDAAVYYGGYDLRFRNDTGGHILIKAWTGGGTVSVALYGRSPKRTVRYATGEFFNITKPSVRKLPDPKMWVGLTKNEQGPQPGRSIEVQRTVMLNGKFLFKDTIVSVYSPRDSVIKVGTMPRPAVTGAASPRPTVSGATAPRP